MLNGIDQTLLGLVAVKMKYFKISVDVNLAVAILLSIGECKDIQLQYLELELWTNQIEQKSNGGKLSKGIISSKKDFMDFFQEEIKVAQSKLKSFTIRFNGKANYREKLTASLEKDFGTMLGLLKRHLSFKTQKKLSSKEKTNSWLTRVPYQTKGLLMMKISRFLFNSTELGVHSTFANFPKFVYKPGTQSTNYLQNLKDIHEVMQNIDFTKCWGKDLTTNLRNYLDKVYQSQEEMLTYDDDQYFYHDYYYDDIDEVRPNAIPKK